MQVKMLRRISSLMETSSHGVASPEQVTLTSPRMSVLEVDEEPVKRDYGVNTLTLGDTSRNPLLEYQTAVHYSQLPEHLAMLRRTQRVESEYQAAIKAATVGSKISARRGNNAGRNRYTDISPYDYNRVPVQGMESNYINASFVDSFTAVHEYVAAQGPLPTTAEHFWKMIWQQQSRQIAMMTTLEEGGRIKCVQYWPEGDDTLEYNELSITCRETEAMGDFATVRMLVVSNSLTGEEREVKQYHFTGWPDHGVPTSTSDFLQYWMRVRTDRQFPLNVGPIVVHCSAGVGRTGVFVLCDIAIDAMLSSQFVDVPHLLTQMREQRDHLVQVAAQYQFCYSVLSRVAEALVAEDACDPGDRVLLSCLRARQRELIGDNGPKPVDGDYIDVMRADAAALTEPNSPVVGLTAYTLSSPDRNLALTSFTLSNQDQLSPPVPVRRGSDDVSSISSISSISQSVRSATHRDTGSSAIRPAKSTGAVASTATVTASASTLLLPTSVGLAYVSPATAGSAQAEAVEQISAQGYASPASAVAVSVPAPTFSQPSVTNVPDERVDAVTVAPPAIHVVEPLYDLASPGGNVEHYSAARYQVAPGSNTVQLDDGPIYDLASAVPASKLARTARQGQGQETAHTQGEDQDQHGPSPSQSATVAKPGDPSANTHLKEPVRIGESDSESGEESESHTPSGRPRSVTGPMQWDQDYEGPSRPLQPRELVPAMVESIERARQRQLQKDRAREARRQRDAAAAAAAQAAAVQALQAQIQMPPSPAQRRNVPAPVSEQLTSGDADQEFIAMLMRRRLGDVAAAPPTPAPALPRVASPLPDDDYSEETRL